MKYNIILDLTIILKNQIKIVILKIQISFQKYLINGLKVKIILDFYVFFQKNLEIFDRQKYNNILDCTIIFMYISENLPLKQ